MKKASRARTEMRTDARGESAASATKHTPADFKAPHIIRMKPKRKLFVVLLVVFLAWFAFLAVMYFKTVRPARQGGVATADALRVG